MTESESDIKITTDTPYLASRASYVVCIMRILEKIDSNVVAPHCIWKLLIWSDLLPGDSRYCEISNIRRTKNPNLNVFRLAVAFAQSNEARCQVENEDVIGAAPTADAPTTSEWSTILLPTVVRLILETWQYFKIICKLFNLVGFSAIIYNIFLVWWTSRKKWSKRHGLSHRICTFSFCFALLC